MIASVTGLLAASGLDWVVIQVAGIGVRLFVPPTTVSELASHPRSEPVSLATTLIVREDSLTLYGFGSDHERDTFDILLSVSGIGPRIGLAALSVLSPVEIADAVATENLTALQRIPGVGKKSAQRMVLEIAGKLASFEAEVAPVAQVQADYHGEVEAALEQLGWNKAAAQKALATVEGDFGDASSLLRAALIQLGGSRG